MNQLTLVGRLVNDIKLKTLDDGNVVANVTLAVTRDYKNSKGIYETDFIPFQLWNNIAKNALEQCPKGTMMGIKGRIETKTIKDENGNNKKIQVNVADKVTFITTRGQPKKDMER